MEITEVVTANEKIIRSSIFFGVLAVMAVWELIAPCRSLSVSKTVRWLNNISLVFINTFLVRLLFPTAAIGVAAFASNNGWGILNYYELPILLSIIISVVAMDFVIYLQHVLVHSIPALWRFHRLHHADLDYDVTTGSRFHPVEIILSMLIKFATIIVLGPPVIAVIIFEIILNATSMFNHSNVQLPFGMDKFVRLFLVTPDMHRVHHSIEDDEANSNFGFSLPWWDRLFGTYREQPRQGHTGMTIGIRQFREVKQVAWLPGMMMLPFKGKVSDYAINRRQWADEKENKHE